MLLKMETVIAKANNIERTRDTEIIDYQADGSYDRWTSFHGYHVRNYFATNKHFGTLNEFKELRDALQDNGIKLVIDFVTNHTSHPGYCCLCLRHKSGP